MNIQDLIKNIFVEVCSAYTKCLIKDKMSNEKAFYYLQKLYTPAFGKVAATALIRASVFAYLKETEKMNEQLTFFLDNINLDKSVLEVLK